MYVELDDICLTFYYAIQIVYSFIFLKQVARAFAMACGYHVMKDLFLAISPVLGTPCLSLLLYVIHLIA